MDEELVDAAREGDKWAFVEIVARYQAVVSGVALAILKDFGASEDVAQEVFLTAWKKIQNIHQPKKLRGWLVSIARTRALDHLRRVKSTKLSESEIQLASEKSEQPDEMVASGEEMALVVSALERIPETYRLPLVLFYREGHSISLVAESLNIKETAARKRLSRGRKMLRNEMSGVIESVLGRTLPTSVFTMSVASAIGALSTPKAVAAQTFVQAVGATAKTSTSTASFGALTTMTTSKLTFASVVATAVICVSAGYQVRVTTEPGTTDLRTSPPIVLPSQTDKKNAMRFELPDSALIAEWKRLHAEHGSGPQAMPRIHAAIMKISNSFDRRALLSALTAEWAEVSPKTGWEFYGRKVKRDWQLDLFLNEYIRHDGWLALDALTIANDPPWKKLLRRRLPEVVKHLLPKVAQRDPSEFAMLIDQLPKPSDDWDNNIHDAFENLANENFEYARTSAEKIAGTNRLQALSAIAKVWAEDDGPSAFDWAKTELEGAERNELIRNVLVGWAKMDPGAALSRIGVIPSGVKKGILLPTGERVLKAAAASDLVATVHWLRDHPGIVPRKNTLCNE